MVQGQVFLRGEWGRGGLALFLFTFFKVYHFFFFFFFLPAIWLPHGQLWAILKGTASLTRC